MKLADAYRFALRNIFRNRRKSFLAVLAVAIGVASFFLVSSIGSGVYRLAEEELSQLGIDGLSLRLEQTEDPSIDPEYAAVLERDVEGVRSAMPFSLHYGSSKLRYEKRDTVMWCVGSGMVETMDLELLHGRGIGAADTASHARVAVVDAEYAFSAYRRTNIVGKQIRLLVGSAWNDYEIVGVIASQTEALNQVVGTKIGTFVYIPYTTYQDNMGEQHVEQIAIRCAETADSAAVTQAVARYMEQADHRTGEYVVENITGYLDRVKGIVGLIRLLVMAIGSISLIVAGIGVMNGMLSSLDSRKMEIGILLSVGAIPGDLLKTMLLESTFICLLGGMTGAIIGVLAAGGVCMLISVPQTAGISDMIAAFMISCVSGILFGFIPAYKASKMDPVLIFRQE